MSEAVSERNNLPKGWTVTSVSSIGDVVTGNTPSKKNRHYYGNYISFFKPTDLNSGYYVSSSTERLSYEGLTKARLIPKKSILVTCIGATIGKIGFSRIVGTTNQQINSIIPNLKMAIPEYLYFICISSKFQESLLAASSSTTLPIINKSTFSKLSVPLPPLNEQKRIVFKIKSIFEQIDEARTRLELASGMLNKLRNSVLRQAFEGKLVPQDPNDEPAEVLLKNIHGNSKEINFEKDNLPKGWLACKLEDISMKINSGFASGKHNKSEEGIPHIRPMNINSSGNIDLSVIKYVEDNLKDKLKKDDVLFNNTNSPKLLGKTALIKYTSNWGYSNHMTRIRFDTSIIKPSWVAIFLHKLFLDGFYKQIAKNHVNQSSVNSTDLATKVPIIIAPLNEQKRIVSKIELIFSKIDAIERHIELTLSLLNYLKGSTLKQAFEGKLVPQDPGDKPVEILVQKTKQEKQLIKSQKLPYRRNNVK